MRKFPKTAALILCLLLVTAVLGACTDSGAGDQTAAPTATTAPTSAATDEPAPEEYTYTGSAPVTQDPATLTVLTTNGGSKIYNWEDFDWFNAAIDMSGVTLDIEMLDASTYNDVCKTRLAAGVDLQDIIRLPGDDSDMTYINSGMFVELTDYYADFGFNLTSRFENGYESVKNQITTPDGKIFYVPAFNPDNSIRCLMINAPWLAQCSLSAPADMDGFYDMLTAFKQNDMNGNGDVGDEVPLFMRGGMTQLFGMYWGLDLMSGWNADANGVVTCSYAAPEYLEFLQYFNRLYSEGLLYNEFATANLDTQNALFSANQVGSIIHFISNMTSYSSKVDPEWSIETDELIMQVFDAPKGPYGQMYYGNTLNAASYWGVTRDCADPELAFKLLDFMVGEEAMVLWYGFEGTDYTLDADANKVFTDVYINNKDGYRSNMGHNCLALPNAKTAEVQLAYETEKTIAQYAIATEWVSQPALQFCYTLPEEVEVVSTYKADITTYFSEMFTTFITSANAPTQEAFDAYLEDLAAMHVDDLTGVYQAQYDRTH